jgi:hypothetical protein
MTKKLHQLLFVAARLKFVNDFGEPFLAYFGESPVFGPSA